MIRSPHTTHSASSAIHQVWLLLRLPADSTSNPDRWYPASTPLIHSFNPTADVNECTWLILMRTMSSHGIAPALPPWTADYSIGSSDSRNHYTHCFNLSLFVGTYQAAKIPAKIPATTLAKPPAKYPPKPPKDTPDEGKWNISPKQTKSTSTHAPKPHWWHEKTHSGVLNKRGTRKGSLAGCEEKSHQEENVRLCERRFWPIPYIKTEIVSK